MPSSMALSVSGARTGSTVSGSAAWCQRQATASAHDPRIASIWASMSARGGTPKPMAKLFQMATACGLSCAALSNRMTAPSALEMVA